jgi:hypothetical protein
MPAIFDVQVRFSAGGNGWEWDFNSDGLLYLTTPPGALFRLTKVTDCPQYGKFVYAIQSVSNDKYLVVSGQNRQIIANSESAEKALLLHAQPSNGNTDPFLWEVADTADYLRVALDQANLILADGTAGGNQVSECQFHIIGSTVSTIVSN